MGEQSVEVVKGVYRPSAEVTSRQCSQPWRTTWSGTRPRDALRRPYHGPDSVAENVFGPPIEDIPDFEATLQGLIASGDAVVVIARYAGTLTATGRALRPPRRAHLGRAGWEDHPLPAVRGHGKARRGGVGSPEHPLVR